MADVWLFRLAPPGQAWDLPGWFLYSASASVAPINRSGATVRHPAGLSEVEVVESFEPTGGNSTGDNLARVTTYIQAPATLLLARGWNLAGWYGELSIWREGTTYEAREIVFRGLVDSYNTPGPGQALELTLLPPKLESGASYPPTTAVVSQGDTWTDPQSSGDFYPWVFGAPGAFKLTAGDPDLTPGSRAYVVDTTATAQLALIAGHRVLASTVELYSAPEELSDTFAVTHQEDGQGRLCAVVDVSGKNGVWTLDSGAELYVTDWGSGGHLNPFGNTDLLSQAGDVLHFLLAQQRPGMLDEAAWRTASPRLNRIRLDGTWAESAIPWEWASQQILPLLPALWVIGGPFGARPIMLDETPPTLCPEVTVGRDVYRDVDSGPEPQGTSSVISRATVSYALGVQFDRFRAQISMSWNQRRGEIDGAGVTASALRAYALVGNIEKTLDGTPIYDRTEGYATACRMLDLLGRAATNNTLWMQLERRLPYRLGRAFRLTDTNYSYDRQLVYVTGRRLTLTRAEITFTDLR